jgi:hypothetical protein
MAKQSSVDELFESLGVNAILEEINATNTATVDSEDDYTLTVDDDEYSNQADRPADEIGDDSVEIEEADDDEVDDAKPDKKGKKDADVEVDDDDDDDDKDDKKDKDDDDDADVEVDDDDDDDKDDKKSKKDDEVEVDDDDDAKKEDFDLELDDDDDDGPQIEINPDELLEDVISSIATVDKSDEFTLTIQDDEYSNQTKKPKDDSDADTIEIEDGDLDMEIKDTDLTDVENNLDPDKMLEDVMASIATVDKSDEFTLVTQDDEYSDQAKKPKDDFKPDTVEITKGKVNEVKSATIDTEDDYSLTIQDDEYVDRSKKPRDSSDEDTIEIEEPDSISVDQAISNIKNGKETDYLVSLDDDDDEVMDNPNNDSSLQPVYISASEEEKIAADVKKFLASEDADLLEAPMYKNTRVVVGKDAKKERLAGAYVLAIAKAKNDPLLVKYIKFNKRRKTIKEMLRTKYLAKAKTLMMKHKVDTEA